MFNIESVKYVGAAEQPVSKLLRILTKFNSQYPSVEKKLWIQALHRYKKYVKLILYNCPNFHGAPYISKESMTQSHQAGSSINVTKGELS